MNRIIDKESISENVIQMVIEAPEIARKRKAGQFVVLMTDEKGERIPLTIVDEDREAGTIDIIYQVVGKTTACLAAMNPGDELFSVVGPLGKATDIEQFGTCVCVGGGVGIGVVYPIAKALKELGNRVVSIIGARSKNILILEEKMRAVSDELLVATDDGSYGHHGFVSDVLQSRIDAGETIDRVFAVGPVPMMRVLSELTRPYHIPTIVSLNPIMVDATGMCGACRVSVGGETKLACVDGPEFDGHEVDFGLLASRLRMYTEQEKEAIDHLECQCHGRK
ncbi:MAG: sulfide/dihydroorotate dehydrogenase-like FAD/NAD-binding protein [Deltaproteobacteria bacterium]|nr:sulfide/dihydroorotate dehydrogenase-like FAD/NAD-binding protein [Deltaproteobacteria bacterium]